MRQLIDQPPRLLELNDGRSLAYHLYGVPTGRPLYFFHGFPGCRLQAALVHEQAVAANVCLVAFDRPGFGQSSSYPARTIVGLADDVRQLADHLGHSGFGVLGVSCGGAYALACAQRLSNRVSYVGLLAGIGPMDLPEIRKGQLALLTLVFLLARRNPILASPPLLLDRLLFRSNPERAVRSLSALLTRPDQHLLASDSTVRGIFGASLAEAYRQGISGAMREAHLIGSERGYPLEKIFQPVDVYQGGMDRNVPPIMGRYLAERIPNARFHFYPEEGHLSIMVNRSSECLTRFAENHGSTLVQQALNELQEPA